MKKYIPTILAAAMLCLLGGCADSGNATVSSTAASDRMTDDTEEGAYHKITAAKAKEMMDEGGVTIVDVRRPDEYENAHIPGAILLSNETISETAESTLTDKDAKLIVYCRTGVRSKQASDTLVSLGYTQVYDMGGINDWTYETETGTVRETEEKMK